MSKSLERDIQTLQRTEGNLNFLISSYIEGRVDYRLAKAAISNEARFLERLIEIRLPKETILLGSVQPLKHTEVVEESDEFLVNQIISDCALLIVASKIALEMLKEVRDE